jgi:hypothetical protein
MLIEDRIIAAIKMFEDRLDKERMSWALDCVEHNEAGLAIDTLADLLGDHDVRLTPAEFDELQTLAKLTASDLSRVSFLADQVRE